MERYPHARPHVLMNANPNHLPAWVAAINGYFASLAGNHEWAIIWYKIAIKNSNTCPILIWSFLRWEEKIEGILQKMAK